MLNFWFSWHYLKPLRYKLWHPIDHVHVFSKNGNITEKIKNHVNTTHFITEKLND